MSGLPSLTCSRASVVCVAGLKTLAANAYSPASGTSTSKATYLANFKCDHPIADDIREVHEFSVPAHDVLLAGFPCQPFSIAGVSKKNALGRPHGFADETQGTLFYDVARIIAKRKPAAFLLENVKNLISHDKRRTFSTIMRVLEEELGYV